jgi:beta-glucosidase
MEVCKDERVASIMKKLTLEEKVALVMGEVFEDGRSTDYIYTPGSVARTSEQSVEKGLININLADGPAGVRLLRESALASDGRIKYLKGNYPIASMELFKEAEPIEEGDILLYQYTSAFPVATALAQSFNTDLVEQIGKRVSGEMREFNITYWLAPGMNIHRNPLCGRNFEYYSEDPLLTGKIAAALIKGVQSIKGNYITIKHLACNNAEENRTFSDSIVKARALREIYLKGFEIAVKEAHATGAMTSYNRINGVYASDSYDMSVKILRDEWGFDGVIMTDWTATIEGHASNVQAVKTGHLIMPGGRYYYDEVMKGLKDGSLKEEELDIPVSFLVKAILDSDVAARIKAEDII